jgi:hypothetical protein
MLQLAVIILATAAHSGARPDACQILTKKEITAVQGEAYSDTKLTPRDNGSRCFYQLPTFTKSVSVDVIRGSGREFWNQNFERSEEAEEKTRPSLRVRGVGDEAFWAGSKVAGSLYVRKGEAVLRVSVGGPGTESEKIAKSKRLALKALRRL